MDLKTLRNRASRSDNREAYEVVERTASGRIGVGVRLGGSRPPRYFVEIVLDPSPNRPRVTPGLLKRAGSLAGRLLERGYALRAEDDGCLTCEKAVDARGIPREVREMRELMAAS